MAVRAGRFFPDIRFRSIQRSRPVEFSLFMAIQAGHSLLVMNIRLAAEVTGKFGIYPPAMTCGACFAVILCNELMIFDKSG